MSGHWLREALLAVRCVLVPRGSRRELAYRAFRRGPLASRRPIPDAEAAVDPGAGRGRLALLEQYVSSAPSPQVALDIFEGEWSSRLPEPFTALRAGSTPLFEDPRVEWGVAQLGGVEGCTVLELGPLEAGHTYMLERLGAASIVAVEANVRAYLRCLTVKEIVDLRRARFLCGDFVEYLRAGPGRFDVCVASGVLYHMVNPVELVALVAGVADRLFLWTHYYDAALIRRRADHAAAFMGATPAEYRGFRHTLHHRRYPEAALAWTGFCGAGQTESAWLTRDDILGSLRHFGYRDIRVGFEEPDHPNGPSFACVAIRSASAARA